MKLQELKNILSSMNGVVVAFSGGLDSTFLLKVAKDVLGEKVLAVTADSSVYMEEEIEEAKRLAGSIGVEHRIIETDEMFDDHFKNNPKDRCYWCKKGLFSKLLKIAKNEGYQWVIDGANRDDESDFRPGSKAAQELGVRSPLQEAGLTKEDIRVLSRELKLSTWNKPSMACISSRFPYGTEITKDAITRIKSAERFLKKLGFTQVRVRHYGDTARIEILKDEFKNILNAEVRDKISNEFKSIGYKYTTLDLEGYRTGSMNL